MNELLLKAGTNDYNDNILDDREISDVSTHSSNIKNASADTKMKNTLSLLPTLWMITVTYQILTV